MDKRERGGKKCSSRALRSFLNGARRRKVCKAACASCGGQVRAAVRVVPTTCMRPLSRMPLLVVDVCDSSWLSNRAQRRTVEGEVN